MLPSKKILISLSILIIGIGALAYYSTQNKGKDYTNLPKNLVVATSTDFSSFSKQDSDGDGLPDWEEGLYGTDAKKTDTDGDGTSDSKEISLERNPLIKGPNDFLVSKDAPTIATSTAKKEKLTLTDNFARDFFTQFMNLKQSGVKVTAENAEQVATDYLKNAPLPGIEAKQYSEKDFTLIDTNKTSLTNYQNAFAAAFAKYWPKGIPNELSVMQQAFSEGNANAISDMAVVYGSYQNILNIILALPVPKLAISLHLNVVNSLSTYIQTLKMIQMSFVDPLSGLVGINSYENNQSNLLISITNLRLYFINSLQDF